ncbi:hypothetical protein F5Y02DRAFT_420557 [Annulohypoxylon stygium]|nr:hypothetical protein F5Y02DRAFT_420557 [Annulohypoxylon stygium]
MDSLLEIPRPDLPQQRWRDVQLRDIVPKDGFFYTTIGFGGAHAKWAIEAVVPGLEQDKTEKLLANVILDAQHIANEFLNDAPSHEDMDHHFYRLPAFRMLRRACRLHHWTSRGSDYECFNFFWWLMYSRLLFIKVSRVTGMSDDLAQRQNGKLAQALDGLMNMKPSNWPVEPYCWLSEHERDEAVKEILGCDPEELLKEANMPWARADENYGG